MPPQQQPLSYAPCLFNHATWKTVAKMIIDGLLKGFTAPGVFKRPSAVNLFDAKVKTWRRWARLSIALCLPKGPT